MRALSGSRILHEGNLVAQGEPENVSDIGIRAHAIEACEMAGRRHSPSAFASEPNNSDNMYLAANSNTQLAGAETIFRG